MEVDRISLHNYETPTEFEKMLIEVSSESLLFLDLEPLPENARRKIELPEKMKRLYALMRITARKEKEFWRPYLDAEQNDLLFQFADILFQNELARMLNGDYSGRPFKMYRHGVLGPEAEKQTPQR